MATDLEELYHQHLEHLPHEDRLRLIELLSRDLAPGAANPKAARNLMELHGLGKEIWQGVDADAYVNSLREEWKDRP
jgi:hypothetical protein